MIVIITDDNSKINSNSNDINNDNNNRYTDEINKFTKTENHELLYIKNLYSRNGDRSLKHHFPGEYAQYLRFRSSQYQILPLRLASLYL